MRFECEEPLFCRFISGFFFDAYISPLNSGRGQHQCFSRAVQRTTVPSIIVRKTKLGVERG